MTFPTALICGGDNFHHSITLLCSSRIHIEIRALEVIKKHQYASNRFCLSPPQNQFCSCELIKTERVTSPSKENQFCLSPCFPVNFIQYLCSYTHVSTVLIFSFNFFP